MSESWRSSGHRHTVRPRWTWAGLVGLVLGLLLIGTGIVLTSWAWAAPGLVVVALGAAAALRGGLLYDVQGAAPGAQWRDVKEGRAHEFPGSDTRRSEDALTRDVRRRWLRRPQDP